MTITINTPNGEPRKIELSAAMQAHFKQPVNHAYTILNQINTGMYERWFAGKKDMVVLDFGANVGLTGLYFLPVCKYLCLVEPTPSHHALMHELIIDNRREQAQIIEFSKNALSENNETVIFCTGHSTENKITSADGYGNGKIEVQGYTLQQFITPIPYQVDFCKVDIEGGEMKALTTEQLKLIHGRVKTFFVEVHPAFGGSQDANMNELLKRFDEAGYLTEVVNYETIVASPII